ncbi:MAG: hypothetical protein MUF49_12320 [Oculatellaceae cyanobacterium Prado106]|jgi:hypothetical protein|nr:hypothetical protein [Oculatellaceae cyanobacterium Prado106]
MYKYDTESGFNSGLKLWLLFIVLFAVLGVGAELSILFGAIAGAANWLIVSYWKATKIPEDGTKTTVEEPDSVFITVKRFTDRIRPTNQVNVPNPFQRKPRRRL